MERHLHLLSKFMIALAVLLFVAICSFGQVTYISTEGASCITVSSGEIQGSSDNYSTLFAINESVTMIKHTIDGMTSTYYVNSKEFKYNDKGQKILYMYVRSDIGNHYIFMCNKDEKLWFCVNPKQDYAWVYSIKASWQE